MSVCERGRATGCRPGDADAGARVRGPPAGHARDQDGATSRTLAPRTVRGPACAGAQLNKVF
jgi:hypothetical protein